ncbi:hypothetical protein [Paraliomyxa miuraensis]|uniref:hypothetical protein n=1 Tax=Paraliomyxa miuraensis TaxID=376150 RepID=UPI002251F576|nr:hypothetical protein [Paraliomyxa miuraensis]MCX4242263.1 hypothetical protein [Paraliomyxa miuraensis]
MNRGIYPSALRSVAIALLLGLGTAVACVDEAVLENEDCAEADDCFNSQECFRTGYQAEASNETPYGWCRPKGEGCAVGTQPGCECLREGALYSCSSRSYEDVLVCPSAQDASCVCLYPTDIDPSLMNNSACPSTM